MGALPLAQIIEVGVAVIQRGDRVLLTRRRAGAHLEGLWEFPGGKREPAELLAECVVREIREELGIEIAIRAPLCTVEHAYADRRVRLHAYRCWIVSGEPRTIEVAEFAWVRPEEIASYDLPPADLPIVQALRGV